MYIRREGKYENLEHKFNGRVVFRVSVKRLLKIFVAFSTFTDIEKKAFLKRATKKQLAQFHYSVRSEDKQT